MRWLAPFAGGLLLTTLSAHAGEVSIRTPSGHRVAAAVEGEGDTAVVVVPGEGETAASFAPLTEELVRAGFTVVSMDLRGQGRDTSTLDDAGWAALPADVDAVLDWSLARRGIDRAVIVGSGVGGTLALAAAADEADVRQAVLLSPQITRQGHSIVQPLTDWGDRAMLLMVGADDEAGRRTAGALAGRLSGPHAVEVSATGGQGPELFTAGPSAAQAVLSWVRDALAAPPPADAATGADVESAVETTGVEFGSDG